MTTTYADSINEIALKTFEVTCFMFPMDEWEMEDEDLERPDGSTRSIVRFDGAVEGGMVINPSEPLLGAIAANMLGVDEASDEEKEGALCEIANIVCGNTVPLFANNQHICYIRPPRIAEPSEDADKTFEGLHREDVTVYLDEGVVEITLYYTQEKIMIKVLIVDDSAVVRKLLSEELNKQKDIEVVGTAMNPYIARDKIVKLKPDVITLDLEMPRMDGLSFLAKLMKHKPMPVVVVSSLTPKNSQNALNALRLGAVDVICKPGSAYSTQNITQDIVKAVRTASVANLSKPQEPVSQARVEVESPMPSGVSLVHTTNKLIAIGSSTGGTRALEAVITQLPPNLPGIVIVQHMPPVFTKSFADRLNSISKVKVKEAEDGDHISHGTVLIAPGSYHMLVEKNGAKYYTRIKQGPPVHHQRPSVDVLFHSVAKAAGVNAMGVILTGMGADGAKGLLAMREHGAYTIGQDEETCVVYGMPREAAKIGAVMDVLPLQRVAGAIVNHMKQKVLEPHL